MRPGKTRRTSTSRPDRDHVPDVESGSCRLSPQVSSASNAQASMNAKGRIGLVQRVEVDPVDLVVEKISALLRRPVEPDLRDRFLVIFAGAGERPLE